MVASVNFEALVTVMLEDKFATFNYQRSVIPDELLGKAVEQNVFQLRAK